MLSPPPRTQRRLFRSLSTSATIDPVNNFKEEIIDHQNFGTLVDGDVQHAEGNGARLLHDGSDWDQEGGPS
jgi:hypothetical protein